VNKNIARLLIAIGVLGALVVLGRTLYYAPNDEIDSGLEVTSEQVVGTIVSGATSDLPSRLLIPKLNIDTKVQALGITRNGNMAAPSNFTDVSWYKLGTVPGQVGSAVMSGHEDNAISLDGVFKHLEDLEVGDDVYVVMKSGKKLHFRVTDEKIYPYNLKGTALNQIFTAKDEASLNLITCTGDWVQEIKTNDKRLVIYTELVK